MSECWICGRATPYDDRKLPLNICARASCQPEREHLRRELGERMEETWGILARFQDKAQEQEA